MSELPQGEQNPRGVLSPALAKHLMVLSGRAVEGDDGLELRGHLDCVGQAILVIAQGEESRSLWRVYLDTAPSPLLDEPVLDELAGLAHDSLGQDPEHVTGAAS